MLERTRGLSVMRIRSMAMIRSPKQIAASSGQPEEKKASALEQTANDLTTRKLSRAYEVEDAVTRLAEALTGKAARSVLLAGKAGVGKTAVFNELVRRRGEFKGHGRSKISSPNPFQIRKHLVRMRAPSLHGRSRPTRRGIPVQKPPLVESGKFAQGC